MPHDRRLGDLETSEGLLRDLYVDLRRRLIEWSSLTHQTPQARMGYVGQHLVSVVTGYPGARSGARGHDLVLPQEAFAEIKTCYRVDQLGYCGKCGSPVANTEEDCPSCGSGEVVRKDDSKWLITIRNSAELDSLFDPTWYYLVLFDFDDFAEQLDINARIWRVDPRRPGFSQCMVDYYFNIKAKSASGAPFNLWPFSPKFYLMRPELIYWSKILESDDVETLVFPGRDVPRLDSVLPLERFAHARTIESSAVASVAKARGVAIDVSKGKRKVFEAFDAASRANGWDAGEVADELAIVTYGDKIAEHREWLPD